MKVRRFSHASVSHESICVILKPNADGSHRNALLRPSYAFLKSYLHAPSHHFSSFDIVFAITKCIFNSEKA